MTTDPPVLDRLREQLVGAVERRQSRTSALASRRRIAAAAAAAVAVSVTVAILVVRSPGDSPGPVAPSTNGSPQSPIGGVASCVERFSVANLGRREVAFDGVIRSIDVPADPSAPASVTFEVTHWYTGGSGGTATLQTYERPGAVTSAGQADGVQLREGQRLLASGDGGFLWSCGFSMLYTPGNAELFAEAFE